jgi:hypothetical protein
MRPFTAADGSATAFVPNIGNWTFNGRQGVIEGGNANQGGFAFGVTFFVQDPGSPFANPGQPNFPYTDAAGALVNVIPQWFRICCNTTLTNLRVIGTLVGQERFSLGPGYLSGMFSAAFNLNGRPWQGIFHIGTNANTGIFGAWYVYYSYAALRVGEDPRIGAALLESWATWNPSADQNRRLNEALFNVLTTNVGGGPIDPAVFDAAAAKWSEYIRQ